jgi:predicted DNA-binding ribbon-helix-helix protein
MKSAVVKRSIVIAGHKTSVSLEDEFWNGLKEIVQKQKMTLAGLVGDIDVRRLHTNLSSAIRLFVLAHFRSQISQTSADRAGSREDMPRMAHAGHQPQQVNGQIGDRPER